jgi:heme oxygenase
MTFNPRHSATLTPLVKHMRPIESVLNVRVTNPSQTPLGTLRERTRELHAHLEAAININAALNSIPTYVRLLCGYLNIYSSFEAALPYHDTCISEIVSQTYRSRVPSLQRDLRELGVDPNDCRRTSADIPLPDLSTLDAVLGALYVVEGSNLGGQIIYREIQQQLMIDMNSGAAFFFGNGEQTGPAWKRFTELLNKSIANPDQAADAAAAMFQTFEYGLQAQTEDGPVQ